jgi:sugar phosphate isomerase/epimerase
MERNLKLSIAIAASNALPSAFVVFRGFEKHIAVAASLGYDGVELALKSAAEINTDKLDRWLTENSMTVSCISTGQVFADTGLMFTDADSSRRKKLVVIFKELIDLASGYGLLVNIGRVRGNLTENDNGESRLRFTGMVHELCSYAATKGVTLVLEPVNRYELNFINSVAEGVELMKEIDRPNMKLMPDLFHMNIEDAAIGYNLARYIDYIGYIHLADSNRLAPGWGHTDFGHIFRQLRSVNYRGWLSVEILPHPEPLAAAKQAIDYLHPFLTTGN